MDKTLTAAYALAAKAIRETKRAVITTHINPDGDAIGSACALHVFLKERGVASRVILPTPLAQNLSWVPSAVDAEVFNAEQHHTAFNEADTIFILDLNSVNRLRGMEAHILQSGATKVCIDHHVEPEQFADVLCTDTQSAATCAMLTTILRMADKTRQFSPAVAMCLYVGIMTDTGNFRFPRTTGDVHRDVASLIDDGADPVRANESIYNTSTASRLNMLGEALRSLRTFYDGTVCIMVITNDDMQRHHCTNDDVEGFVHHTLSIAGVMLGIMIVELPEEVKISFRSKGNVFVRNLAASFAGGGHNYAAGARVRGRTLDAVVHDVVDAAGRVIRTGDATASS